MKKFERGADAMEAAHRIYRAKTRLRRREGARIRNGPPRLTGGEGVFNAVSHGVGGLLAIAAMVLLLLRSHTGLEIMASCFYGISMTVMMFMSGQFRRLQSLKSL